MKFLPIVSRLLIVTLFVSTAPAWVVAETCHPHLFQRTNQTKTELDSVFGSRLAWFSKLIAANPKLGPGSSKTWQSITNGVVRKLTLTLASDGQTYSFELDLAAASPTLVFVKVWTGSASFTASTPTLVTNATLSVKLEDSSGNTVTGGVGGAGVCDPVLGPVPSLVNNSTDYNFNQAVTFPGEW